ncbi:MAG: hypothetical protein PHG06_10140 [Parabacteroides sp.]|nr:hypothetical protein [Parabacteroides sp.]
MAEELDLDLGLELQHEVNISKGIEGNIIDLDLKKCDREVRADIMVGSKDCIRVWGQVIDCECKPVSDALVNLLRSYTHHGKTEYEGVAYTVTDCCGFYQFDICTCDEHDKYKVIVILNPF